MNDKIEEYYPNGKLKSTVPSKDGVQHGHQKIYYETGELMYEGEWKNNKQEGIWKLYYENGDIKRENIFKNHIKISQKEFYQGYKIEFEGKYDEDGNKTGKWCSYHEDGKIKKEEVFNKNIPEFSMEWDEEENLIFEEKYYSKTQNFIEKLKSVELSDDNIQINIIPKKWSFIEELNVSTQWKGDNIQIFTHSYIKWGEFEWSEGLKELLKLLKTHPIENLSSDEVFYLDHLYDDGGNVDVIDVKWDKGYDNKKKEVIYVDLSEKEREELEVYGGLDKLYNDSYYNGVLESEGYIFEKGSIYQIVVKTDKLKCVLTNQN